MGAGWLQGRKREVAYLSLPLSSDTDEIHPFHQVGVQDPVGRLGAEKPRGDEPQARGDSAEGPSPVDSSSCSLCGIIGGTSGWTLSPQIFPMNTRDALHQPFDSFRSVLSSL